jgi:hypothetical protein
MLLPRANSRKSVCLLTAIFFCLSLILPQFSTLAYAPITPIPGLPGPGQLAASNQSPTTNGGIGVRDIERDLKIGVSPNSLPMELPGGIGRTFSSIII